MNVGNEAASAAAAKVCRKRARPVHFATSFLSKKKRDAVRTLVAFCILTVDALRGEPCAPEVNGARCGTDDSLLAMFRLRVDDLYGGRIDRTQPISSERSILIAMQSVVSTYELPAELLIEFGEGVRNDRRVRRYATWSSLERHIHRTYGAVCRMVACVLGVSHSDGQRFANQLASAIALTRIIGEFRSDWQLGQIYFPLTDMAECHCTEADIAASGINDALKRLLDFEIARAKELFRLAAENIGWLGDDGSRMMASVMIVSNLRRLRAGPARSGRVAMRDIVSAWRLARLQPGQPLPSFL